jgi:hypothetical protein
MPARRCVRVRFFKEIGQSDRENAKNFRAARRARAPTALCGACGALETLVGIFSRCRLKVRQFWALHSLERQVAHRPAKSGRETTRSYRVGARQRARFQAPWLARRVEASVTSNLSTALCTRATSAADGAPSRPTKSARANSSAASRASPATWSHFSGAERAANPSATRMLSRSMNTRTENARFRVLAAARCTAACACQYQNPCPLRRWSSSCAADAVFLADAQDGHGDAL